MIAPFCMEEIAELARSIPRETCLRCQAKCCRFGKLIVDPVMFPKAKKLPNGLFEVAITPCTYLDKTMSCSIYDNPGRPKICHEFPVFLKGSTFWIAASCLAVQEGWVQAVLEKEGVAKEKVVSI